MTASWLPIFVSAKHSRTILSIAIDRLEPRFESHPGGKIRKTLKNDNNFDVFCKKKRICRTVGPSLAASLEPLAHHRNVTSLNLFYRYYFGRCSSELAQLVPFPYSRGRSTRYSDRLHDFSVTIPRCYKDVYVNSFFPHTARLWNSLPIECFPLTYDLSGFKSRINRYLLTVPRFFLNKFPVCFNLFVLPFLVTPCLELHGVNTN